MSRRPFRFKETELLRAMRAAQKAGPNWAVDILPDGTIRMAPARNEALSPAPNPEEVNPWDQ